MERMTYPALAVNEASNAPGSTATIPSEIEIGIAITRHIAKIIKTTKKTKIAIETVKTITIKTKEQITTVDSFKIGSF